MTSQPTAETAEPPHQQVKTLETLAEKDEDVVPSSLPRKSREDDAVEQPVVEDGVVSCGVDDEEIDLPYTTGWKLVGLMASITTACFVMLLDMSILVTAIPRITTEFHSLTDIGWYGSAYSLASAALQPLSGKFYTYFKIKWTFLVFLFLFEVGSLLCAVATSSTMFILGRAVAGIGSSGIQNGSFSIVAAAAPLERRPTLMGITMGICQLGLVSGPLIGGALTEYTTWRWCFYINLPIGAIGALLILLVDIPERIAKPKTGLLRIILTKFDLPGFAIFAPFAIMILLALEWGGNDYPWKSAEVIGLFCGGGVAMVVFLLWERRVGEDAMIPLSIIRKREVWSSCLSMLFLFASIMGASYYLPIYFQSIKGVSPFTSGVYMLPVILSQLAFAVVSGFLLQKIGYYLPFSIFSAVVSGMGNGLISTLSPHTNTATWAGYQILLGFGRGMGIQMAIIALQANTSPANTPIATATLVFCQTFGGAMFISIANSIFNNTLKRELLDRVHGNVSAQTIMGVGATGIRSIVPADDLPGVLWAYAKAFDAVFYLVTAGSVCMFIVSWGMGWKDIRKKKTVTTPSVAIEA